MSDLPASSSMRRDIVSAYAASAAKIGSWVIVLGLVYRVFGAEEFAMLALIRGTIGILNYTSLGLAPAMVWMLAEARSATPQAADGPVMSYDSGAAHRPVQSLYANGMVIALISGALAVLVTLGYAHTFNAIYAVPGFLDDEMPVVVIWLGLGTALRLMSDAAGSVLQTQGHIARDNWRIVEAEVVWVLLCLPWFRDINRPLVFITLMYAISGLLLLVRRAASAQRFTRLLLPRWQLIEEAAIKRLLGFGGLVLFAQLADYLYAPTDYILIMRLIGWDAVATYTPAMTIDSGLLLLVAGIANVLLPRTAIAHTSGEAPLVRRYYVRGTFASAGILLAAALPIWFLSPWIFKLWFGDSMPATRAILPLVLVHTVIGGSSAVGRSILLGMGKAKAFTIAALSAGLANVILSYIFVRHLDLGLRGIIYGTIVVVFARCVLWMPWYVLRALRHG